MRFKTDLKNIRTFLECLFLLPWLPRCPACVSPARLTMAVARAHGGAQLAREDRLGPAR